MARAGAPAVLGTWPSASVFGRLAIVGSTCILLACGVGAPGEDATAGPSTPGAAGAAPDRRTHHALVHHAGEGRTYLIGGSTRRGEGYHYFDDVWFWNGTDWTEVSPLPFPRSSHGVVYHAQRDSLILFGGGFARAVRAEGVLWEWRRGEWNALGGDSRAGRSEPGMCYDHGRGRVVLFGGWDAANTYRGETWEWAGADLAEVAGAGPDPRAGHAFLFDPVRKRCLLFGGRGDKGYLSDTWEWNGEKWRQLAVAGPSARWFAGSATDTKGNRIVLFGGGGPDGDLGDTWTWDGQRWSEVSGDGPSPRMGVKLASAERGVVLFGGRQATSEGFQDHADTWELQKRSWVRRRD